jgi:hypothetical protein
MPPSRPSDSRARRTRLQRRCCPSAAARGFCSRERRCRCGRKRGVEPLQNVCVLDASAGARETPPSQHQEATKSSPSSSSHLASPPPLTSHLLLSFPLLTSSSPLPPFHQNNLDEFYSLMTFVQPGVLGDAALFRRVFSDPISKGCVKEGSTKLHTLTNIPHLLHIHPLTLSPHSHTPALSLLHAHTHTHTHRRDRSATEEEKELGEAGDKELAAKAPH